MTADVADGVQRVPASALVDADDGVEAVSASLARYGCCVLTQAAKAHRAWSVLLVAAAHVHAREAEMRYRMWRGRHGGWRGYAPSEAAARQIAAVVDVDPAFLAAAASRRFSAFEGGPLWPTAVGCPSGGVIDSVQPWPDGSDFVHHVSEAFLDAARFGTDLLRRVLASRQPSRSAPALTFDAPCSSFRLLRYDPEPPGGEHLDYELLTMVASDAPGLEVRDVDGRWRRPEAGPDDLVLIAGDLLEAVTGGAVGAALHRVTAEGTRHSAVVFVAPDFGVEAVMPSTGRRMPFGQFLEGMLVRAMPELWSRYEAGQLNLPYALPEPNPFRGECARAGLGTGARQRYGRGPAPTWEVRLGTEGAFGARGQAAQRPAAAHPLHPGPGGGCR
jgi:isopenicillin N synthase-like dioxygenase